MKVKESVLSWLLEDDNPPVQYLTLCNLLHQSPDNFDVIKARKGLMNYQPTQQILQEMDDIISGKDEYERYWKYTGMYWQLIFLGQFQADGRDSRVQKLVDIVLQDRKWVNTRGGQCLTANLLRSLMQLGFGQHPVVQSEVESLAKKIVDDNGIQCDVMNYSLLTHCYMAIPKLLLCFAEIPNSKGSDVVKKAIEILTSTMIDNKVYEYVSSNKKEWEKNPSVCSEKR